MFHFYTPWKRQSFLTYSRGMKIDHRAEMCSATYSQYWHYIEISQLIDFYIMKALNNNKFMKIQEKLNMMKIKIRIVSRIFIYDGAFMQ